MTRSGPEELAAAGMKAYKQGHFELAVESFNQAGSLYSEMAQAGQAAEMANNAAVAYLQLDKPELALEVLAGTPETFAREGNTKLQAQALGNQASACEALDKREEAKALYQQALALLQEIGDQDSQAFTLQGLSRLQLKDGQPLQALDSMQAAMEVKPRSGIAGRLIRRLLSLPARFLNR